MPPSLAAAARPTPPILDAFMAYVATFFLHRRPQTRRMVSMSSRTLRTAGLRRAYRLPPTRAVLLPLSHAVTDLPHTHRRPFHNYFVTHLPSSSLHPDSRSSAGPGHKLPRAASTPHTVPPNNSSGATPTPAVAAVTPPGLPPHAALRELTVVRIPLRSAKHHFGVSVSRGQRAYNEDTHQAGTIHMPAFAKRVPVSLVRSQVAKAVGGGEGTSADSALGDPQVFYFGVFDGHGGGECSEFLRDELHGYVEEAAAEFGLGSSLKRGEGEGSMREPEGGVPVGGQQQQQVQVQGQGGSEGEGEEGSRAVKLEAELLAEYKRTIGGYFRRFRPAYFSVPPEAPSTRDPSSSSSSQQDPSSSQPPAQQQPHQPTLESVLTYAFLRADLDFVSAQARKPDPDDPYIADNVPLNKDDILGRSPHHLPPSGHGIGSSSPHRFKGGSTATTALISTPTPSPFWHPAAHSTLVVAHVGDTRALLCETQSGSPVALTSDHHPAAPAESRRLQKFLAGDSMATADSFGEERIQGLANSRAFGDMKAKRLGVSAEPDVVRVELRPAEYAFLVLCSDGVSGTLSDREIVDVVKEAGTPEEGARRVVEYATEVSGDGDNATCLVVRLGGWERRSEGGVGSLGTREMREMRRAEALDPRRRRRQ